MRKTISLFLSFILLFLLTPLNIFAISDYGTEKNPYLVSSANDVINMHNDLSGYYKLTCNIDMTGINFEPIGNENEGAFTGTIDGNGYTISNLNLDLPDNKYVGLIGYLEGTVKNCTITNAVISGYRYVGSFVGYADTESAIVNCSTTCKMTAKNEFRSVMAGGIVGYSSGVIKQCNSHGTINLTESSVGYSYIGGICGSTSANVNYCNNYMSVTSYRGYLYIGGVAGKSSSTIEYCNNYGEISATASNTYIGGIAGDGNTIEMCCNFGNILGGTGSSGWDDYLVYIGGIAGKAICASNCINQGNISRDSDTFSRVTYVGGICGYIYHQKNRAAIINCINQGIIDLPDECAGGIAGATGSGYYYNPGEISDCLNFDKPMIGYTAYNDFTNMAGKVSNSITLADSKKAGGGTYCKVDNVYDWIDNSINSDISKNNHLSLSALKNINSYTNIDFSDNWCIDSKINSGLPMPRNMPYHIDLNESVLLIKPGEETQLNAFINGINESVTWTSNNSNVSVSKNGKVYANKPGNCIVTATNNNGMKANCFIKILKNAQSLKLENDIIELKTDNTYQLTYKTNPLDANETVIWESSNPSVVTVDQSGQVKAVKKGQSIIKCTTTSTGYSDTCTVTVTGKPITGISINSNYNNTIINVNETYKIPFNISPTQHSGNVTYSSSNEKVAEVSENGEVTGKTIGTTVITAKSDTGYSAECTIIVKSKALKIELDKKQIVISKGCTEKLQSIITPNDSTDTLSYSTSNYYVASVSEDGVVLAKSQGIATITVTTSSGQKAYCIVTVTDPAIAVSSVTLNKASAVLTSADKIQLTANVLPENATDKSIDWKSSDETIAIVSNTGVVTAISPGTATITATSNNGYYHECNIDVVAANGSSFIAKSTKASAGEIAEYTVSVVKNPGISSFKLNLDYDSSLLTPIEIVKNPQISGSLSSNLKDEERTSLNVMWYSSDDYIDNADLFTVKFRVADDVEYGTEIPVTMSSGTSDIKNSSGKKLAFFMNNTSVKVEKPLLGDILEDGEIDFRDLNLLARNVSGLETLSERQLLAADTEQDKIIDTKDTVRLLQHLTGWTGADLVYMFAMTNDVPAIKVGTASLNAANEAEIPVTIENNPGVAGFRFELDYDKTAVDVLSISPNDTVSENFMTNLGTDDKLYVSWYNAENINTNGTLFTIKVKYKDNCDIQFSPISIVEADNNMCNQKRENVVAEYETGYLMADSFVKENEAIANGIYSAGLYFDNSYEGKSAIAILALYDEKGKLITLSSKDITIKPGKQNISVSLKPVEFDNFKLFIWDSLNTMKPLTK